jgi:hypothetical protein
MAIVKVVKNNYTAEPLYQWSVNQVLRVYGLSLARVPEVHFTNQAMSRAIVRQATMDAAGVITVDVPNSLLQTPYTITAYICGYDGLTFETYHKLKLPIKTRPKPTNYTLINDQEVYSFNALENAVQNALHDLADAEGKLGTATADLKNAEAVLQQTVRDIDNTVDASVRAALPGFLDDTLADPDKAAPAAVVGARLDKLDAQHTIEKIVEVAFDEGEPTETFGFYIELPETLSHYPIFIIRAINMRRHPDHPSQSYKRTCTISAVASLTSTTSLNTLMSVDLGSSSRYNLQKLIYPFEVNPGEVCTQSSDSGTNTTIFADTKYIYVSISDAGLAAGARFEIWGAVK